MLSSCCLWKPDVVAWPLPPAPTPPRFESSRNRDWRLGWVDRAGAVASSLGSVRQEKRRGSAAARRDRETRDRPGGEDLVGENKRRSWRPAAALSDSRARPLASVLRLPTPLRHVGQPEDSLAWEREEISPNVPSELSRCCHSSRTFPHTQRMDLLKPSRDLFPLSLT